MIRNFQLLERTSPDEAFGYLNDILVQMWDGPSREESERQQMSRVELPWRSERGHTCH